VEFLSDVRGGVISVVMVVVVVVINIIVLLKYIQQKILISFPLRILPISLYLQGKIDNKYNFSVTSALGLKSRSEIFINPY